MFAMQLICKYMHIDRHAYVKYEVFNESFKSCYIKVSLCNICCGRRGAALYLSKSPITLVTYNICLKSTTETI